MEFKLRNNREALTGFVQGVVMSYDRGNSLLKYFKFFDVIVKVGKEGTTIISIEPHTNDYQVLNPQTIVVTAETTLNYVIEQVERSCELIHEEYVRFYLNVNNG